MTAMEQIEFISVEARKLGMKYGEYVAKFGHTLPKPKEEKQGEYAPSGKKKPKPSEKICAVCGKPYLGHGRSKYCPLCVLEGKRQKELEWNDKRKGKTVDPNSRAFANCKICGNVFEKRHGHQIYCVGCKREKDNAYKAKYNREKYYPKVRAKREKIQE